MSTRNVAGGHTLPPNPHWIEFERTDGDESRWPTNTECVVDHEGQVNYMRPVGDHESASIHWRTQIGKKVAEKLSMPAGNNYVLKSWPKGYAFYDHNKGKKDSPRHDLYLIGSVSVNRFRSIPEFVPHAIWLLQDPTLDRVNCECKYCAKKPQRLISETLGFKASPGAARPQREPRRRGPAAPYASVRRAPKPRLEGPKQSMAPERYDDLQALYAEFELATRRWFREGEVVWCALDPPIRGAHESITFWPGLVMETQVKSEAIPRAQPDNDVDMQDGTQGGGESSSGAAENGGTPREDSPVPWTISQKTMYKMKLLGVDKVYLAADEHVLPYQGYAPSQALLKAMQDIPLEQMLLNPEQIAAFHPCPPDAPESSPERFAQAAAPYSVAVQIAANIAKYWTPTDQWDFTMALPNSAPDASASQPATLQAALVAAEAASLSAQTNGVSGTREMDSVELRALSTKMLGQIPPTPTFTQLRYQGLWWGAERIWTDELIRLKVARRQIAPNGAPNIYPASGPSRSTIEELGYTEDSDSLASLGSLDRGVFMKLESLFVVDAPNADGTGTTKECRASGMLYELADEGWEEPEHAQPAASDNGKGKESAGSTAQDATAAAGLTTPPRPSHPPSSNGPVELQTGAPFMSGPSPLRPPPLPNPDPSVPLQDTAASMLSASQPPPPAPSSPPPKPPAATTPLVDASYPLPPAPRGFRFRPILPPGHEVVVSLTLVSGRYYPGLLAHPLLAPLMRDLHAAARSRRPVDSQHLLALEGLYPGFFNAVDPTRWKPSRTAMVKDADADGRGEMAQVWEHIQGMRASQEVGPPPASASASGVAVAVG